ncbi:Sirt6 [Symbiodinium sp. KB8]|nr:Sirt6 [Symbiodinium sp. KB8]
MAEATVRELINFGFSEDRAREAVANIGDVSDVQLAINWLLDHGEEDKGGAVEFKHCPHICELPLGTIVKKAALEFGNPCAKGCKGSENWVCLMCGVTHCGRYVNKHALHHWQETREADSRALTVGEAAAGVCRRGHFLAMGLMDLSVWCYECESYVDHEVLGPLVARMQRLKFGGADEEEPEPEVGSILDADPQSAHGFLGDPNWPLPRLASACNEEARPGYKTMKAHEYLDEPAVLKAKVKLLADLIARSRNCVAYTGAGISTASGIKDYATKASSSSSSSSAKSPWLAEPSYAHHVLVALWKSGNLKHWVQQNHDGLPQKAGFPQKDINEIHGAWWDPSNPVVPMDGTLRSDLIQWMLDWESRVDLCLALGTSMVGMNADRMAVSPAKRAQRLHRDEALGTVIVALQQTQYDKISSLRIFARLDDVLNELASLLNLDVASAPVLSQRRQEAIIPYGRDGRKSTTAQLHLDLRVGSKLRVVDQPDWDQAKYGELCQVMEAPEELAKQGHVQLLFPGDGLKKSVTRFLGGWWIEAAIKGELDKIPVVPAE